MLNNKQQRYLKKLAHARKPVVTIGNAGLTSAVMQEIDSSLNHHELLKIRINAGGKNERRALAEAICEQLKADFVLAIGHIVAIYRPAQNTGSKQKTAKIVLP